MLNAYVPRCLACSATIFIAVIALVPMKVFAADTIAKPRAIEEIVVTAQKREQSVQDVPMAMSALTAQALQERGIDDASSLQFAVPSIQVGGIVGNTSVNIRGVGLNLVVANGSPGVAIHVDGVYQPVAAMGNLAQVDLERIEVLRGPQGTLYGRNATGGAVNFVTRAPGEDFEGYIQAGYAEYDESRVQGVINVPFGNRVRARAVVDWRDQRDGFVENVLPGGKDVLKSEAVSGRIRVSTDLTESLSLDLTGAIVDVSGPLYSYTLHNEPVDVAVEVNPWLADAWVVLDPWKTSVDGRIDLDRDYRSLSANLQWDVGRFQVRSITGYQYLEDDTWGDDDGTDVDAFPPHRVYENETFTQELNLSGIMGPVETVLGVFYMEDDYDSLIDYTYPLGVSVLPPGSRQVFQQMPLNTKSLAFFGDATWSVSPAFRLIAGIRYSEDELTNTQENFLRFGPAGDPVYVCPLQTNDADFDSTTWRTGAQFDVGENSTLYATVSTGFKAGGFNRNQCGQTYKPEEITAYEIGSKSMFLNNTVTLNAAAFYYDYTDLQLSQQIDIAQQITNAAKAEVQGLEIETSWQPDDHWTVDGSLTLLDATYTDFDNVNGLAPAEGVQDVSGNYLTSAPERAVNLGIAYRTRDLPIGSFTTRVDASYRSEVYFTEFNEPLDRQEAFTLVNASIIWLSPKERYRVRLFGNNLTDEAYIPWMASVNSLGAMIMTWGAPRQLGIEARVNL